MTHPPFGNQLRQQVAANLRAFEPRRASQELLTPAAVALTLVGDENGRAAFIITRRSGSMRAHSGQWALPGGRMEQGEKAEDAARRELEEEIALRLSPKDVLGRLDDFPTRSGYCITPVVFWGPAALPALIPNPDEVASAHVVPLEALDAHGVPRLSEGPEANRPVLSIPFETLRTTVWAPTAALLYQLREVALYGRATRVAHFDQPRFAWR